MKQEYNWWEDPKNKEEVERISWWNKPENQHNVDFPISLVHEGEYWVASTSTNGEKLLGRLLTACAQGKTKEEAISELFSMIRSLSEFDRERVLKYQRWVPFRNGQWGKIGGNWFVIFGLHTYFRYGKNMQGGFYIPLTKLNIMFRSEWTSYRRWKKDKKNDNCSC